MRTHRILIAVVLLTAGCSLPRPSSWERTRVDVIEPLNTSLHRALPKAIRERNLDALLEHYDTQEGHGLPWDWKQAQLLPGDFDEEVLRWHGPPAAEPIRDRYARVLELFTSVESAELRIVDVDWEHPDPGGYPAEVRLIVRGSDGEVQRQLDQRATTRVANREGKWVITEETVTFRELASGVAPRFAVATEQAGIDDVHETEGSPDFHLIGGSYNSSGSAVGDIDGDGDEDIVLASASRLTVYRNDGGGRFTDVSADSGLPRPYPSVATGVVLFDYDNDGFPDLYVAGITDGDRLFRNAGGVFTDVTRSAGIGAARWSSMPVMADYDRDGFLDVYVVRMGDFAHVAPTPNYEARNGLPNTLYHNNGDGTFSDVTATAGVGDTGWGLAGAWGDYDGDGWPDLYVVNEFGSNNLFHNDRDGGFTDVTAASGTADRGAGMGVAWGDYDNDGRLDLFVSNMHANSRWVMFHSDFPIPVPWYLRALSWVTPEVRHRMHQYTDELTRGSTLLHNNGDGTFNDVSNAAGVRDTQWGWSAELFDYDNDGWLDLYAVNGFISNPLLDDV